MGFDSTSETTVQKMDDSELRRVDALSIDMEYFYGTGWQQKITPSSAAKTYVDRINFVVQNEPKLLIAHQYSRYLGDLFGGQMMSGMATKSLSLNDGNGVSFYVFDEINDASEFITKWYTKLNDLDLSDKEKSDIVDEANLVFELNIEIFEELEGSPFLAAWTVAWSTFREKLGLA